jgi:hypothetical protein
MPLASRPSLLLPTPAAFLSLTAEEFASLPAAACAGIREDQLRNTGVSGNASACAGMSAWCMVRLTAAAMGGLQVDCLRAIPDARFDVSPDAIQSLPPTLEAHISPAQFHSITLGSIEWMTAAQVAQLSLSVCGAMWESSINSFEDGTVPAQDPPPCSGFTSQCVEALPPTLLDAVHGRCLAHMQPAVLGSLSGNQSRLLPSDSLCWLLRVRLQRSLSFSALV